MICLKPHRCILILSSLAVILLAGCTSTLKSPSLFVLEAQHPSGHAATPAHEAPLVVVTPISLADYLDQDGIIYQQAPHRITVANHNRWASPLDSQLNDMLYEVLSRQLTNARVERSHGQHHQYYTLQTRIDQFMGHYAGKAHIKGHWRLQDPAGHVVAQHEFNQHIALKQDGYSALVDSLSRGWQEISRQLANALQTQLSASSRHAD